MSSPDSGRPVTNVTLLGIDFTWASLAEREHLCFDATDAAALLLRLEALPGVSEAVVLSTCNRTEVYLAGDGRAADGALRTLRSARPGAPAHSAACLLRQVEGDAAIRHLFEVATGMASRIVGDSLILQQMKQAIHTAGSAGTLGPVLSRAFRQAFSVGERARRTTDIARGDTSLGAVVASAIASRVAGTPRILLVGAGTTARDIARQIAKRRVGALTIANRTRQRADDLAREYGADVAAWADVAAVAGSAEVVVCATASPVPILHAGTIGGRCSLVVDVGVPRNVTPSPAVPCLTVDGLVASRDEARARRALAVPAVEALVAEELASWRTWQANRPVEVLLKDLFAREADARRRLVAEIAACGDLAVSAAVEQAVGRWRGTWLKQHAADLRAWAETRGSGAMPAGAL